MDGDIDGSFGVLLKSYRLVRGLSQEALAEQAGLSREGISALERGARRAPHGATVDHLATTLKLSPTEQARLRAAAAGPRRRKALTPSPPSAAPSLPLRLTSFVGRDREVAEVTALLRQRRLVTLMGPAGVGKTSLAIRIAAELADRFRDGVFFVSLASLSDPALVLQTIAQVLGLPEESGRSAIERLSTALRTTRRLLLLDNFEHLLGAAPELMLLLEDCPQVTLLVTSRSPLHLRGEQEFLVSPLPIAKRHVGLSVAEAIESPAVQLFVERVHEVRPDFSLTPENVQSVAEVCARLDGLPLAIELAAIRIRLFSPAELLARLERRLPLLTGGAGDLPNRQQTLRNTLAWSYGLLTAPEKILFYRLAVFVGGWTFEAAEAIVGKDVDCLDGLGSLIGHSLVRRATFGDEVNRFTMLETIREYAWEQLVASGEAPGVQDRHATWYLALAESLWPPVWKREEVATLDRLEREHDNVRAALRWLQEAGQVERALRLGPALAQFWLINGHLAEGRGQLEAVLALPGAANHPAALAAVRMCAADLASWDGDLRSARRYLEPAVEYCRQAGDRQLGAGALVALANLERDEGDYGRAATLLEEAVARARELGDRRVEGVALHQLGIVVRDQGDPIRALPLLEASLALFRDSGFDDHFVAYVIHNLGLVAEDLGDATRALALYREALYPSSGRENQFRIAMVLDGCSSLAAKAGQPTRALRLMGAATRIRAESGAKIPLMIQGRHARAMDLAKSQLTPKEAEDALAKGSEMLWQDATAYALTDECPV
jgi:predicted ATPase/DNA-binding XRE family transcriptional regulator